MDLAEGHQAALRHLQTQQFALDGSEAAALLTLNLGSGQGHTVREVLKAYGQACGQELPAVVVGRREGDAARSVADPRQAERLLGWRCRRDLQAICADSWCWQSGHPQGDRR